MRRLLIGMLLLLTALVLGIPYLAGQQIPARFFPGTTIVRVYLHEEDGIQRLKLEDYLVGVVAAEMPVEFPEEALKAQAVAARTYVLKRMAGGGVANPVHPGADVCDNPAHGQAWLAREDLKDRWGTLHYYQYYYKVKEAVDETAGQVLVWKGDLIDPAYHASCGGATENAADVWQSEAPYLSSVPCPYDTDPQPVRAVTFRLEELDQVLGTNLNAVPVTEGAGTAAGIKLIEETETGRSKTIAFGNKQFSAMVVRDLLGLRSTRLTWFLDGETVTFTTTGYGHGVGMCQYGSKGLAEHGYDYRIILGHYYSGAEVTEMTKIK